MGTEVGIPIKAPRMTESAKRVTQGTLDGPLIMQIREEEGASAVREFASIGKMGESQGSISARLTEKNLFEG